MSADDLDEAIKNIKDEKAINQLVGSLERSLESQSVNVQYRNGKCDLKESRVDDLTTSPNDSWNNGALKKNNKILFMYAKKGFIFCSLLVSANCFI